MLGAFTLLLDGDGDRRFEVVGEAHVQDRSDGDEEVVAFHAVRDDRGGHAQEEGHTIFGRQRVRVESGRYAASVLDCGG